MERQIGFDISDYVDGSVLIDAADIAKPHVIRLLNEYALRWKLTMTRVGNRIYVGKETRRKQARIS